MEKARRVFELIPYPKSGSFEPSWESLRRYRVPKWYADAKLGIFIQRAQNRFVCALRRLRAAETFRQPNSSGTFSIALLRILYSFL